jgi:hypothetical protein
LAIEHQGFDGFLLPVPSIDAKGFIELLTALLPDSKRLQMLEDNAGRAASKFLNQAYFNQIIHQDVATICSQPDGDC